MVEHERLVGQQTLQGGWKFFEGTFHFVGPSAGASAGLRGKRSRKERHHPASAQLYYTDDQVT